MFLKRYYHASTIQHMVTYRPYRTSSNQSSTSPQDSAFIVDKKTFTRRKCGCDNCYASPTSQRELGSYSIAKWFDVDEGMRETREYQRVRHDSLCMAVRGPPTITYFVSLLTPELHRFRCANHVFPGVRT